MKEIKLSLKEDFTTIEQGTQYELPVYTVRDGVGIARTTETVKLNFVRGSKLKDEEVEKRDGTLHEHLLACMISDLQFKNSLVPSRETSLVITNLQQAQNWLLRRQVDRQARDVEGTYQK